MTPLNELGTIVVLMGGDSAERDISIKSGQAVCRALVEGGANAVAFDVNANTIRDLITLDFDIAFIALHGRGGEDGCIQGLLDWLGKPYTGSGVMASALAMDKWRSKQIWQAQGLPTPIAAFMQNDVEWHRVLEELGGKAIVKPAREGSSIGMRVVTCADELEQSYQYAKQYDNNVIVEQWIEGREFTVGIVGDEALPSIELKTQHDFYDYSAKYESGGTQYLLPSGLSAEKEQELAQLALNAANALDIKGWGRIDVMQDASERFWLLEANTSPGMTDHSLVPMAANAKGWSFLELIHVLLVQAKSQ